MPPLLKQRVSHTETLGGRKDSAQERKCALRIGGKAHLESGRSANGRSEHLGLQWTGRKTSGNIRCA